MCRLREHLIEILVAHAARGIAVAVLFLAEDRELDAAACRMRANATVIFFARSSNEPMQPTQNSTSGRSPRSTSSAIVGMSIPSAHFARSPGLNAHGEPLRSSDSNAGWISARKARLREHEVAPQLVDDVELVDRDRALLHARAAARARPELLLGDVVVEQPVLDHRRGRASSRSRVVALAVHEMRMRELACDRRSTSGAISMSRWRVLTTILRGLSTLPVMFAGHAAVQRPHSVHE